MEGWIKLHRSIKDNWIWQNSTYLRAWIIMLFTVNYEDKKVLIHGNIIECKRGQSLLSLDSWVDKFGLKKQCGSWTIQKVRTFFELLERDQMITKETVHKSTRLTICNYNYYQDIQHDNNKKITRSQHDHNTITTETKESKERKELSWRDSFDVYLLQCKMEYEKFMLDANLLKTQQRLNPNVNIKLSIEKGFVNFWGTEAGWKFKKGKKSKEIDWPATIKNSIGMNKVFYTKEELAKL